VNMRKRIIDIWLRAIEPDNRSTNIQLCGAASFVIGVALFSVAAGFIALGVIVFLLGEVL
jgi:hypothetical protein